MCGGKGDDDVCGGEGGKRGGKKEKGELRYDDKKQVIKRKSLEYEREKRSKDYSTTL